MDAARPLPRQQQQPPSLPGLIFFLAFLFFINSTTTSLAGPDPTDLPLAGGACPPAAPVLPTFASWRLATMLTRRATPLPSADEQMASRAQRSTRAQTGRPRLPARHSSSSRPTWPATSPRGCPSVLPWRFRLRAAPLRADSRASRPLSGRPLARDAPRRTLPSPARSRPRRPLRDQHHRLCAARARGLVQLDGACRPFLNGHPWLDGEGGRRRPGRPAASVPGQARPGARRLPPSRLLQLVLPLLSLQRHRHRPLGSAGSQRDARRLAPRLLPLGVYLPPPPVHLDRPHRPLAAPQRVAPRAARARARAHAPRGLVGPRVQPPVGRRRSGCRWRRRARVDERQGHPRPDGARGHRRRGRRGQPELDGPGSASPAERDGLAEGRDWVRLPCLPSCPAGARPELSD